MLAPSTEMMDALAELAFNELASLPEAEVQRLLQGILAIVSAELRRQCQTHQESSPAREAPPFDQER
jgi:hypothetical protein